MEKEWIVPDTEQTKRMKQYAVSDVYLNSGELLKLLSTKELHSLVVKIKKGKVKASKLKFGKEEITTEERFLENLDKYISHIRNNYYIDNVEQLITIEESLTNRYSKILLCKEDMNTSKHQMELIEKYSVGFIRMYLYNFYSNVLLFSKLYEDNIYTKKLKKDLSKYDFNNDEDIYEIEKIFTKICYLRKNNIYNCFIPLNEIEKNDYDFYATQVEWCLNDYYNLKWNKRYKFYNFDNYFITSNGSTILLNKSSKEEDKYTFEVLIQSPYFSAKIDNFKLDSNEFEELLNRFKKCYKKDNDKSTSDEYVDFVDPAIVFNFWKDSYNYETVEIKYHFNRSTEYYNISLERQDIPLFIKLLENSIK